MDPALMLGFQDLKDCFTFFSGEIHLRFSASVSDSWLTRLSRSAPKKRKKERKKERKKGKNEKKRKDSRWEGGGLRDSFSAVGQDGVNTGTDHAPAWSIADRWFNPLGWHGWRALQHTEQPTQPPPPPLPSPKRVANKYQQPEKHGADVEVVVVEVKVEEAEEKEEEEEEEEGEKEKVEPKKPDEGFFSLSEEVI